MEYRWDIDRDIDIPPILAIANSLAMRRYKVNTDNTVFITQSINNR